MAARRWYLLIPLALAGVGISWLAYTQMPASYSAGAVYQVKAPTVSVEPATTRRGLNLAPPPPPPDPVEEAEKAAAELVASVRPDAPAGTPRGRAGTEPVTLTRRPDPSSITVRALADTGAHAGDAVGAVNSRLGDRLRELDEERGAKADERMTLETSVPLTVDPAIRTVGRKVFVVTLAFCLALSVVLAAAVERSARRRRLLLAESDSDGDPDAEPEIEVAGTGDGASAGSEAPVRAETLAERLVRAERAAGAEPGGEPTPAAGAERGVAAAQVPELDDSPPTEIVPAVPAQGETDAPAAEPALAALNAAPGKGAPAKNAMATSAVVATSGVVTSDRSGDPADRKIVADPDAEPDTAVIPVVDEQTPAPFGSPQQSGASRKSGAVQQTGGTRQTGTSRPTGGTPKAGFGQPGPAQQRGTARHTGGTPRVGPPGPAQRPGTSRQTGGTPKVGPGQPGAAERPGASRQTGSTSGSGRGPAVRRTPPPVPMRGPERQRTGGQPPAQPPRNGEPSRSVQPPRNDQPPRKSEPPRNVESPRNTGPQRPVRPVAQSGRAPMEPRPAPDVELPIPAVAAPVAVSPAVRAGTGSQRPVRAGEPRREPRVQPGPGVPPGGPRQPGSGRGPGPAASPAGPGASGPVTGTGRRPGPAGSSGSTVGPPSSPAPADRGAGPFNRGTGGWPPPATAGAAPSGPEPVPGPDRSGDDAGRRADFDQREQ